MTWIVTFWSNKNHPGIPSMSQHVPKSVHTQPSFKVLLSSPTSHLLSLTFSLSDLPFTSLPFLSLLILFTLPSWTLLYPQRQLQIDQYPLTSALPDKFIFYGALDSFLQLHIRISTLIYHRDFKFNMSKMELTVHGRQDDGSSQMSTSWSQHLWTY